MTETRTTILASVLAAALVSSCHAPMHVELPPTVRLDGLYGGARRPVDVAALRLKALHVIPKTPTRRVEGPGITSEDRELALVELVAVIDEGGTLYVTDVLHDELPAAYSFGKLAARDVELTSPDGVFRGARRLFTPVPDPLAVLDTGYRVDVRVGALSKRVVFRPLYDAALIAPFARASAARAPGLDGDDAIAVARDAAFDGREGDAGARGVQGAAGADGKAAKKSGQPGGRGGKGGRGGDGEEGAA
ncbi:hypothetical protein L6R52_22145, partial [Myxococcota bacterium]|nr:hypothetical protein [Myxococcota bacterium]